MGRVCGAIHSDAMPNNQFVEHTQSQADWSTADRSCRGLADCAQSAESIELCQKCCVENVCVRRQACTCSMSKSVSRVTILTGVCLSEFALCVRLNVSMSTAGPPSPSKACCAAKPTNHSAQSNTRTQCAKTSRNLNHGCAQQRKSNDIHGDVRRRAERAYMAAFCSLPERADWNYTPTNQNKEGR